MPLPIQDAKTETRRAIQDARELCHDLNLAEDKYLVAVATLIMTEQRAAREDPADMWHTVIDRIKAREAASGNRDVQIPDDQPRHMRSKFSAKCVYCGERYPEGAEIVFLGKSKGGAHLACYNESIERG